MGRRKYFISTYELRLTDTICHHEFSLGSMKILKQAMPDGQTGSE